MNLEEIKQFLDQYADNPWNRLGLLLCALASDIDLHFYNTDSIVLYYKPVNYAPDYFDFTVFSASNYRRDKGKYIDRLFNLKRIRLNDRKHFNDFVSLITEDPFHINETIDQLVPYRVGYRPVSEVLTQSQNLVWNYNGLVRLTYLFYVHWLYSRNETSYNSAKLKANSGELAETLFKNCLLNAPTKFKDCFHDLPDFDDERCIELWKAMYRIPVELPTVSTSKNVNAVRKFKDNGHYDDDFMLGLYLQAKFLQVITDNKVDFPVNYISMALGGSIPSEFKSDNSTISPMVPERYMEAEKKILYSEVANTFKNYEAVGNMINALKDIEVLPFMLNAGYYERRRSLLYYETEFVLKRFVGALYGIRLAVYDPNPLTMEVLTEKYPDIVTVFPSAITAAIYKAENKNRIVFSVDGNDIRHPYGQEEKDGNLSDVKGILLFWRSNDAAELLKKMEFFFSLSDGIHIIACAPVVCFEELRKTDDMRAYHIETAYILPEYGPDSNSFPKNYILFLIERRREGENDLTKLRKVIEYTEPDETTGEERRYWTELSRAVEVPLVSSPESPSWLWANYHLRDMEKKERKTRCFEYSPELRIYYSWSPRCGRGRCHYYAYPTERLEKRQRLKRGKALIETEISADSEPVAEELARRFLFTPEVREIAKNDIAKALGSKEYSLKNVSLKTYYYLIKNDLKGRTYFNYQYANALFESDLFMDFRTRTDIAVDSVKRVMDGFLSGVKDKNDRLKYWEQVNVLFHYAVKNKELAENPINWFVSSMRETDSRYRELREGITKKTLSQTDNVRKIR